VRPSTGRRLRRAKARALSRIHLEASLPHSGTVTPASAPGPQPTARSAPRYTSCTQRTRTRALAAYTELHLGFVAIHPYADGNGRMARLLASVPVLRAGLPPMLVDATERRRYLTLAGDVSLSRGAPTPGTPLVRRALPVSRMRQMFAESWQSTLDLVDAYHARQAERDVRSAGRHGRDA
jgi:hypothetical protein